MASATRQVACMGGEFLTVFGRHLVEELPAFVHRPYLVVTMDDLWPQFADRLERRPGWRPPRHVIGGRATWRPRPTRSGSPRASSASGAARRIDVAKFFAWRRRLPLFQVPTAMTVNAPFGHRCGLRRDGLVRYLGWAVPEAVYVDFDVIASAPAAINRAGVGDILCYHTAHLDWRLARDTGHEEPHWPYDERLVSQARERLDSVLGALDDIHDVNEAGIRTLMEAHRWGGATFHASGWNPRHIEGVEHFFFYNLERADRPPLHPRPAGRARHRPRIGAPWRTAPTRCSRRCIESASTSGPRRWA